ncbi:MAG: hypothetical protein COV60_01760 [Candidatus Magasanikbacteria bacterium CG11_big_fil_rev_8_21_14_0_20_43_7]|uniref:Uncharacterized protein n=1 Tax=Candidatus Magasanikbacteria bacterium CG11_big_fil_rev_8_21_14_0_20_43_7 TaxID=1974654 RepID=A0A2H0N2P0_9BACT|nr:MAG: hypothetical protein COV60_01760 [Candidatus Magasanikbacteria bacterium CG11_big_fil_rev_8_21_14_0_20_43_7]
MLEKNITDISPKKEKDILSPVFHDPAELAELMKKNIQWSEAIFQQNKKIARTLKWSMIGSYLRLALILIPLIIGIIYLPPLLSAVWSQYQSVIGLGTGVPGGENESLQMLIEQFGGGASAIDVQNFLGKFSGGQ